MAKVYPESYYHDPKNGAVQELSKKEWYEADKAARKRYKTHYGCAGCWHKGDEVFTDKYTCTIGQFPSVAGYCHKWWSDRSKRGPDET
jgi:hypothetical protein